jgi:hypothetical protein
MHLWVLINMNRKAVLQRNWMETVIFMSIAAWQFCLISSGYQPHFPDFSSHPAYRNIAHQLQGYWQFPSSFPRAFSRRLSFILLAMPSSPLRAFLSSYEKKIAIYISFPEAVHL